MQVQKKLHNERKMELFNLSQQRQRMAVTSDKAKAQSQYGSNRFAMLSEKAS